MNAVNLVDGIDGLAAGICLFASLAMFFISMITLNALGMALSAVLAGAILGFLVFNFPPARLFLGNSGSNLLGFLVAALSILALE
jgi:UDP-GlcNAc:undecaprenyl-phosphate GlcNAc-1-phosphate transferase